MEGQVTLGDDDFDAFVLGELRGLLRLAHALTGNSHDAWDLVQETLVTVGLHWRRIERRGAASSFARTTLIRLNIKRWRRAVRETVAAVPDRAPSAEVDQVPVLSDTVRAALMGLGRRQRTTIVLRYLYDLTLREIAAEMDCQIGTVKSQLFRAEGHLRASLAPQTRPEDETPAPYPAGGTMS
jgi:RNA polymerase sigma-70 factor (sigma-E family)